MLRKMFGFKRVEIIGSWGTLYNEELYNVHPSPNIVTVIK
jgi:hypothetical protein